MLVLESPCEAEYHTILSKGIHRHISKPSSWKPKRCQCIDCDRKKYWEDRVLCHWCGYEICVWLNVLCIMLKDAGSNVPGRNNYGKSIGKTNVRLLPSMTYREFEAQQRERWQSKALSIVVNEQQMTNGSAISGNKKGIEMIRDISGQRTARQGAQVDVHDAKV